MKRSTQSSRPHLFSWFELGPARPERIEEPDTTTGALAATLRRDPVAVATLAALLLLAVFELGTRLVPLGLGAMTRFLPLVHLALAVVAIQMGIRHIIHQAERRLWSGLALAFSLRLAADALVLLLGPPKLYLALLADILRTLSFLAFVFAIERPVERRAGIHPTDLGRLLTWPGGSTFALGLLAYFSLIPVLLDPAFYETWLPSAYLFLIFELYLVVHLAVLASTTESLRWRMLHSLLFLAMSTLLLVDLLEVFVTAGVLGAEWHAAARLLWSLPFLLLVCGARLRRHAFPNEESLFDSVSRKDPLPWPQGNVVVFALAFPLIHLAFQVTGRLDEATAGAREGFVLAWLLVFGAMALFQQRALERRAKSLWTERMRAEEALHRSNETLRLANERSRAEEALRKSEEKFLKAFRSIPDSMVISTLAEGRIREVNESFQTYFGYSREEVLGKTGIELDLWVEIEDRAMMTRILRERGAVRNFEFSFYNKRGDKRLALLSGEILDLDGETCLLMVLRDITERKKAEDKIREQAALLDKAQDAISVRDLEGRILYWNKSAERVYAFSADEVLGKNVDGMIQPHGVDEVAAAQAETLERGEWLGDLVQMRRDGTETVVESRWTLVRDERGKATSMLVINTEVTERRRLERRLRRAERLESIGVVASGMARDLSNLLTPIRVGAAALQDASLEKKYVPLIASLSEHARRGSEMVKQVLTFAGQADGERTSFLPRHLLQDVERLVREQSPDIGFEAQVGEEPWPVVGDAGPMHQVLASLGTNACEAMAEGGGTVRLEISNVWMDKFYARRHAEAREGPYVVLTVSDTGSGIPRENLEKIWDPFFSTKKEGGGGLSLAMSRAIVQAHGGFMTVYSEVGSGTSFQVYLPAREMGPVEPPRDLPAGHGERVLVVDDDASIRDIIRETLEAFGYRVRVAASGAEAIEVYRSHGTEIDVVLLDMMMPVIDGFSAVGELIDIDPGVVVIAVSGLVSKERVREVENVRVFLEKPYTAEKLLRTLHEVLTPEPAGEATAETKNEGELAHEKKR